MYIWQVAEWPEFQFAEQALAPALQQVLSTQQRLLGDVPLEIRQLDSNSPAFDEEESDAAAQMNSLIQNALIRNAISTSAIEGEVLDVGSVRSSVARHLGLETVGLQSGTKQSDALIQMLLQAMNDLSQPLTLENLCSWQRLLFPELPLIDNITVGAMRDDAASNGVDELAPMQVVSVKKGRYVVHFEAPPADSLNNEMGAFLAWFNTQRSGDVHPFIRAGIAHLWFVTLHPFDDGNGRLARAITDRALAQAEHASVRLYSMSATIEAHRKDYYTHLEFTQNLRSVSQINESGDEPVHTPMDITAWLHWFLTMLNEAMEEGCHVIERVAAKSRFWYRHSQTVLHARQIKVLNRLLDSFGSEFTQGINAAKYQSIAKVSKATATRDLADLVEKGCLVRLPAGGRSTRYQVNVK